MAVALSTGLRVVAIPPTQEVVAELWRRFFRARHLFPYQFPATLSDLIDVVTASDTAIYALTADEEWVGVVVFTRILTAAQAQKVAEPNAEAHVLIWDRAGLGVPQMAREACLQAMRDFGLRRLMAEIPDWNRLAYNYARRVGFVPIGVYRQRVLREDGWHDARLLDALEKDLRAAAAKQTLEATDGTGSQPRQPAGRKEG